MNGERPIDSGSTPSSRCSIVALPAATTSSTSSRAMPAVAHTLPKQAVDRGHDRGSQLLEPLGTVHLGVAHARQHVGAERRLPVDRRLHRRRRRRPADPPSVATTVVVPTSIETPNSRSVVSPGLDIDRARSPTTVAVTVDAPSSSTAQASCGSTDAACDTSSPSSTSASVTRRSRLRASSSVGGVEREQILHRVRLQQHEPPDAHRRGLGHAHRARHLDHHVLGDLALARKPPALVEPVRDVAVVGERALGMALHDPHLALAARAAAPARGLDRDARPVRGVEQRRARRARARSCRSART